MNKIFIPGVFLFAVMFHVVEMRFSYNTYPHTITRATTHLPKVLRRTCRLIPDPGPCRANITMYYFHPEGQGCITFQWGGCQGNGNRFDTYEECNDKCLSKSDKKPRPRYCELTYDYGFCFGAVKRWHYDHLWKVCKEQIYSGCGGNKNNFYNKEQCESICRLGRGVMTLPPTTAKLKKILIINPPNTTPFRGKDQATTKDNTASTKLEDKTTTTKS